MNDYPKYPFAMLWDDLIHNAYMRLKYGPDYEWDQETEEGPEPSRRLVRLLAIWLLIDGYFSYLYHPVLRLICRCRGHNVVDDGSYANPESGADHLRCDRCSESWSHTYY